MVPLETSPVDAVTGLASRFAFRQVLQQRLQECRRHDDWLGLVLLDVAGPLSRLVVKRVAALLAASVRRSDFCARYAEGRFAVLLEGADRAAVPRIGQRVRRGVLVALMDRRRVSVGTAAWHPSEGRPRLFRDAAAARHRSARIAPFPVPAPRGSEEV